MFGVLGYRPTEHYAWTSIKSAKQANTEIQLPCDCLFSVPEKLLPAQPHAVALRSLTCSNSDTIRTSRGTQPAIVENGPSAVEMSPSRYRLFAFPRPARIARARR
jgi:hypothetical protein